MRFQVGRHAPTAPPPLIPVSTQEGVPGSVEYGNSNRPNETMASPYKPPQSMSAAVPERVPYALNGWLCFLIGVNLLNPPLINLLTQRLMGQIPELTLDLFEDLFFASRMSSLALIQIVNIAILALLLAGKRLGFFLFALTTAYVFYIKFCFVDWQAAFTSVLGFAILCGLLFVRRARDFKRLH